MRTSQRKWGGLSEHPKSIPARQRYRTTLRVGTLAIRETRGVCSHGENYSPHGKLPLPPTGVYPSPFGRRRFSSTRQGVGFTPNDYPTNHTDGYAQSPADSCMTWEGCLQECLIRSSPSVSVGPQRKRRRPECFPRDPASRKVSSPGCPPFAEWYAEKSAVSNTSIACRFFTQLCCPCHRPSTAQVAHFRFLTYQEHGRLGKTIREWSLPRAHSAVASDPEALQVCQLPFHCTTSRARPAVLPVCSALTASATRA